MKQWECEINLRMEIKKAFEEANIEVPFPRRIIIKED